jgi:hypothetical protein
MKKLFLSFPSLFTSKPSFFINLFIDIEITKKFYV